MSKATLLELADRVEKASGPDRELDGKIFIAVTPSVSDAGRIDQMGGVVGWWPKGKPYQSAREVSAYTASLDAAMTLVPEGWSNLMAWNAKGCVCDVHSRPLGDFDGMWPAHARAATPALALTAAALRARAQQESSDAVD